MKNFLKFLLVFMLILSPYYNGLSQIMPVTPCDEVESGTLPEALKELPTLMEKLVSVGIPGLVIGIESSKGSYYNAAGYAQLENKIPMGLCHLQYIQSISKTYLAVTVLQLYEAGKIDLDTAVSTYLPKNLAEMIVDSDKMTVRMLLNHTSGIPEYNFLPKYISVLLQDPEHAFVPMDYMELIKGEEPDFPPGSKYSYRNSGYVLLALMMDKLTGDHAQNMQEQVFDKIGLENTFYRIDPNYLAYPNLVNSYWDRFSDGIIENSSFLQVQNVSKMVGDDGIVTTSKDALRFLQALIKGELLSLETLAEMQTWAMDSSGEPAYGLGLDYTIIEGQKAYGHGGGGLGSGSQLYYYPDKDLYVFMVINLATVTESPIHKDAQAVLDQIYRLIFNN